MAGWMFGTTRARIHELGQDSFKGLMGRPFLNGGIVMGFMFEQLEVYQKSVDLADSLIGITGGFPRGFGFLGNQLDRAALSIATNLAEGNGRSTRPDRRHFFTIARGSTHECIPLLEIARRRDLVTATDYNRFRWELEVIAKMVSGLISGLDKRRA
ncbi:MAG TPA: four helix bundle protein [Planctomycetota bacterium]|nr:four helix bundle protein [Planctomycetota bacterium]